MKLTNTDTRSPRNAFLLLEWPVLAVALGLQCWALWSLNDANRFHRLSGTQAGAESGDYGFQYGTQLMTVTSTRTSRAASQTVTAVTSYTRTLYPYVYGTAYYTSEYAAIGSTPPSVAAPTMAPRAWMKPARTSYSTGNPLYDSGGSDTESFLKAMEAVWAIVVAALAVRVIMTPVYFACGGAARTATHRQRRYWAIVMVTWTSIALPLLLGAGIAGWALLGDWYLDDFKTSPGLIASLVFYALSGLTSIAALAFVGRDLDKINKVGRAYTEKGHVNVRGDNDSM